MVIAIIGILAALIIISIQNARQKAVDSKVKSNVASIGKALSQYQLDNQEKFFIGSSSTIDIGTTPNELATALSPSYLVATTAFDSGGRAAKYASNIAGSSYAMAWELGSSNEALVTSGNGVYATDAANTAGAIDAANNTAANALSFDGQNDYASVPDNADFNPAGDFTVSFWAKPSGTYANNLSLIEKWTGAGNSYPFVFRTTSAGVNNTVTFIVRNTVPTSFGATGDGTNNITVGGTDGWHHIVGKRSGGTIYLVIDNDSTPPSTA